MESNPLSNIEHLLTETGVIAHKTRRSFASSLVDAMIRSRSVIFSQIAQFFDKKIKTASIERRIQDFFQKVAFDYKALIHLLMSFVHHDALVLSIDRTEWDFGGTQINILCVLVSIGKMGVPIYFEMLDNNSGNSNTDARIDVLKQVIQAVGVERIAYLIMDREFIGQKWLSWLKGEGILFCVRVPKHHCIILADGDKLTAASWKVGKAETIVKDVCVDGVRVDMSLSLDNKGELLFLIGTVDSLLIKQIYKKRWTIEVFFQATKGRGFAMENSCLRNLEKYRKLFAMVSIAYSVCWAVGIEAARQNPVKRKKHGYPAYSVFRRGLNLIRDVLCGRDKPDCIHLALYKANERLKAVAKTVG
jgi:hypothetical protein